MNQIANTNPPIEYTPSADMSKVERTVGVDDRITRYIFCIGDFIVPQDKHQLASIGGWAGGYYLGTESFPTAQRTQYFMVRGAIVPLELTVRPVKADQEVSAQMKESRATVGGKAVDRPVYECYPGHDASLALSDEYKEYGFVEIESLRGAHWDDHAAITTQLHFFPQWQEWMRGEAPIPTLLTDWEGLIREGMNNVDERNPLLITVGEQMLESARQFRQYAESVIRYNRELVRKGANDAGFSVGWQGRAQLFAEQLNVELEPEERVRSIAQTQVDQQAETGKFLRQLAQEMAEDRKATREQTAVLADALSGNAPKVKPEPAKQADEPKPKPSNKKKETDKKAE